MIMKRLIFLVLLFFIGFNTFGAKVKRAVLFGNHTQVTATSDSLTYRIFMDMNGDYYPEQFIDNTEIRNENSQLRLWAANHEDKFSLIAESYHLQQTAYSMKNYWILQDSIIASISKSINRKSREFSSLTFLIHGFRKRLARPTGDLDNSTSLIDNEKVKQGFNKINNTSFFVEVYWDGKYETTSNYWVFGRMFKKEAIPNATNTGYSLRRVFSKIDKQDIRVVSHSTGTFVSASLFFNKEKCQENGFNTPSQEKIDIVLMASASPGKKLLKRYYHRNTTIDYKIQDNYRLINAYNPNDPILKKKYVWYIPAAPRITGNTALGCNWKRESNKLDNYFKKHFQNSTFNGFNFKDNGYNHYFYNYSKNPELKHLIFHLENK